MPGKNTSPLFTLKNTTSLISLHNSLLSFKNKKQKGKEQISLLPPSPPLPKTKPDPQTCAAHLDLVLHIYIVQTNHFLNHNNSSINITYYFNFIFDLLFPFEIWSSLKVEFMGRLVEFWIFNFFLFVLSKCGVASFEFNAFYSKNSSDVSLLESLSHLESVYGVSSAAVPADALMVGLTLVQGAAPKMAVCLDGTLPGYHLHRGFGTGANSWLIQLEGGGWCNNLRTCIYRKKTHRGSSVLFEKQIPFTGILSNKPEENPDFFNWNRVKIRYCDGASFAGDSENKAAGLQFRGQRIWLAVIDELMSKGMRNASQALLSGCSAGGLASILHCDEFQSLFPSSSKVKCLSDAGLFMDAADVSGGHTLRNFFQGVVSLQGVEKNLPRNCTDHLDPTLCFFPQNVIASIKTPLFILNAAYDSWQVQESLAPRTADPQGNWHDCKSNNELCSSSQIQFLQEFRDHMLNAVQGFSASRQNGLFINSCFAHCQSERQDTWFADNSPVLNKKTVAIAVGDWYFDRGSIKAIDCAYPCDSTCHNLIFK